MRPADVIAVSAIVLTATLVVSQIIVPRMTPDRVPEGAHAETATSVKPSTASVDSSGAMPASGANAAILRQKQDGHYWADADVDGTHVEFMVDTGASTVALTYVDAQRIGLDPAGLDYSWRIRTAGGEVMGASVLLPAIKIAQVEVGNVEAMVLKDGLSQSLLGMSFLSQLESYEFRRENLVLRQ